MDENCGSILIVDDDPGFRDFLSTLCSQAGYTCRAAATRQEALASAAANRPDVVLLDVKLGRASGYQVCRDLRERFGELLSIILVSGARTDSSDRVAGLLLGADDYVTKPFDPEELLARVQRALARGSSADSESAADRKRLTPREQEILRLLANGHGTRAISGQLHISPKTVSTHVQRILVKLGLHSRGEAVAFAYREGLVQEPGAPRLALSRT
jgi:DNA-binding NarL/FixJ family response regulator